MKIGERKSPCYDCKSEASRALCSRKCKPLKDYQLFLEQQDDGVERKSTLGGSKYSLQLPQ